MPWHRQSHADPARGAAEKGQAAGVAAANVAAAAHFWCTTRAHGNEKTLTSGLPDMPSNRQSRIPFAVPPEDLHRLRRPRPRHARQARLDPQAHAQRADVTRLPQWTMDVSAAAGRGKVKHGSPRHPARACASQAARLRRPLAPSRGPGPIAGFATAIALTRRTSWQPRGL
jgi:hypothetical protein